jgi:hypothetical protein
MRVLLELDKKAGLIGAVPKGLSADEQGLSGHRSATVNPAGVICVRKTPDSRRPTLGLLHKLKYPLPGR